MLHDIQMQTGRVGRGLYIRSNSDQAPPGRTMQAEAVEDLPQWLFQTAVPELEIAQMATDIQGALNPDPMRDSCCGPSSLQQDSRLAALYPPVCPVATI